MSSSPPPRRLPRDRLRPQVLLRDPSPDRGPHVHRHRPLKPVRLRRVHHPPLPRLPRDDLRRQKVEDPPHPPRPRPPGRQTLGLTVELLVVRPVLRTRHRLELPEILQKPVRRPRVERPVELRKPPRLREPLPDRLHSLGLARLQLLVPCLHRAVEDPSPPLVLPPLPRERLRELRPERRRIPLPDRDDHELAPHRRRRRHRLPQRPPDLRKRPRERLRPDLQRSGRLPEGEDEGGEDHGAPEPDAPDRDEGSP